MGKDLRQYIHRRRKVILIDVKVSRATSLWQCATTRSRCMTHGARGCVLDRGKRPMVGLPSRRQKKRRCTAERLTCRSVDGCRLEDSRRQPDCAIVYERGE